MTPTAILQAGWAALDQALRENSLTMSDQARYWILGKAYRESGLGAVDPPSVFAQFDGTNNWGAVYWPSRTSPPNPFSLEFKEGHDTAPGGVPVTTLIAVYATQVDGAKGMLFVYRKDGDVIPVLADPNATTYDFARALYKHGYFGGCNVGRDGAPSLNRGQSFAKRADQLAAMLASNPNATVQCVGTRRVVDILKDTQAAADDANIREYARMIDSGASAARAAMGAPPVPQPVTPVTPPSQPTVTPPSQPSTSSGLWWQLPTLGGLLYGGYRLAKRFQKERRT